MTKQNIWTKVDWRCCKLRLIDTLEVEVQQNTNNKLKCLVTLSITQQQQFKGIELININDNVNFDDEKQQQKA